METLFGALIFVVLAAIFFYRLRQVTSFSRSSMFAARGMKGSALRYGFGTLIGQLLTVGADDPRVTCTALLVLVADADGGLSNAEKKTLLEKVRTVFELPKGDAEDLYLRARGLAYSYPDPDYMRNQLVEATVNLGGRDTIDDMIAMVTSVGSAETGNLTDKARHVVEKLQQLKG